VLDFRLISLGVSSKEQVVLLRRERRGVRAVVPRGVQLGHRLKDVVDGGTDFFPVRQLDRLDPMGVEQSRHARRGQAAEEQRVFPVGAVHGGLGRRPQVKRISGGLEGGDVPNGQRENSLDARYRPGAADPHDGGTRKRRVQ